MAISSRISHFSSGPRLSMADNPNPLFSIPLSCDFTRCSISVAFVCDAYKQALLYRESFSTPCFSVSDSLTASSDSIWAMTIFSALADSASNAC